MRRAAKARGRPGAPARARSRGAPFAVALAVLLFPFATAATASGAADQASEYAVKAAFLYNFAKFVTWPTEASDSHTGSFCIAVVGDDPVGDALKDLVQGKNLNGRTIRVESFADPRSVGPCHILFFPGRAAYSGKDALRSLSAPGVLTVGEAVDFTRAGGVIRLYTEEKKMRFEININAARRAGLHISSKMLALARVVEDAPQGDEKP